MGDDLMSKKKPSYPISPKLDYYLSEYSRNIKIPIFYEDLLRFSGSIVVYDEDDNDTLWLRVFYNEFEREEIDYALKKVYSILISDGNDEILQYLNVDTIDFCTFGNSQPFRIKVRNVLNDNFTYFYIKKADASRIYGLELEDMLSPNRLNYLVYKDTLIEEHIAGIPGDIFIKEHLPTLTEFQKSQIAKEFVKFNERCMIRLLGDMRSYNYVIVATPDFDHVVYKIRAIDFDQQSYEGRLKVYRPQFFKENNEMVELVRSKLQKTSIGQYKIEERSIVAKRILNKLEQLRDLIDCMETDCISQDVYVESLRMEIFDFTNDLQFKKAKNMGEILRAALDFIRRNYEDVNMKSLLQ